MSKLQILISFKEKESELYNHIMQQGDKSNYVKDCVKEIRLRREKQTKKEITAKEEIDLGCLS